MVKMDMEEQLKEYGLDEKDIGEDMDNFLVVFNRKSDEVKYIMSQLIKYPSIRNGLIDGTITIKLSKNDYTVIKRGL